MPFIDTWNYIQLNLNIGQQINNWTIDKHYLGDKFTISSVNQSIINVSTPNAHNIQRVHRDDFESVYNIWHLYKAGTFPRHQIRDSITRFSKYVISILYWVEINNNGVLP